MNQFRSIKRVPLQVFIIILSIFALGQLVIAQQPDRGFQTANTYAASGLEIVNMTNGNLMMNIPIASLPPGRGTSPGYSITLQYNSKLWESNQTTHNDGNPDEYGNTNYITTELGLSPNGGWRLQTGFAIQVTSRLNFESPNPCWKGDPVEHLSYIWKLEMLMPDGSVKQFFPETGRASYIGMGDDGYANIDYNGMRYASTKETIPTCFVNSTTSQVSTSGMNYITMDGSRMRLFIPYHSTYLEPNSRNWKLYFPDGTLVEQFPPDNSAVEQRMTDRNGNFIEHREGKIIDQLGRYIEFTNDSENGDQIIRVKGVGGETVDTRLRRAERWVQKPYRKTTEASAPEIQRYGNAFVSVNSITKIIFPTQLGTQSMDFEYYADDEQPDYEDYTEGWGELKKITLPTGATSTYQFMDIGTGDEEDTADLILQRFASRKDLQYDEQFDNQSPIQRTDSWLYTVSKSANGIVSPNGAVNTENLIYYSSGSNWDGGMAFKSVNPDGSFVERIWNHNIPYSLTSGVPNVPGQFQGVGSANSFVKTEFTTITNSSNQPAWTAIKDFKYDKNGNVLEIKEYDWFAADSIPRTSGKPSIPSSELTLKRKTVNTYYNQTADADSATGNSYSYSDPSSPKLKNVIKSTEVQDGSETPVSRSEFFYDDASNTGNLTETKIWDSTNGALATPDSNGFRLNSSNSISMTTTYNTYGAPTSVTDPNGNVTQYTYGNVSGPSGNVTGLYPTQTKMAYGIAVERTSTAVYDFYTGLVTLSTDVDNDVSTATTYDALGRPTKVAAAVGESEEIWTTTEYDVEERRVIVRSDIEAKGDGKKVAIQHYDQLGRVRLTRTLEDSANEDPEDEADGIKVQTRYRYDDGDSPETSNGSYSLTSNPYRAATSGAATSDGTMGWTLSYTTKTGKHSEVKTFAGAILPAPFVTSGANTNSTGMVSTDIDADRALVTDQAGKQRISKSNALGQLTDIWEIMSSSDAATVSITFPNQSIAYGYQTSYSYDTLNNLKTVSQGSQTRSFSYSSLSRLLSATNPESGTISYEYDNNGNLTEKTDARSIETDYTYDALNRVTLREYSDSTPEVTYTYGSAAPAIGKLTKVTTGNVSTPFSVTEYTQFDILGRVKKSKQTTDGTVYPEMEYTYNLSGGLIEQKYPSGRIVKNILDNNGDLSIVRSKKSSNYGYWNYADNFTYTAAGAVQSMQLGNFKWESTQFNSRLQPTQIALGTTQATTDVLKLDYTYNTPSTADNNGNILSQTITVPTVGSNTGFTAVQTYTYDSLNRIKDAKELISTTETWKQTFQYDRYGNRSFDEGGTSPNYLTTNLVRTCSTSSYNPNGICEKQKVNPTFSASTNRIIQDQDGDSVNDYQFDASGNTTKDADSRTFIYDAENKQIEVKNASNQTIGEYFYDGDGKRVKKVVPDTGETTIFVYDADGKMVAEYSTQLADSPQVSYLTTDHLGSPRINTDENGAVIARHDYQPFGEEIARAINGEDNVRKQFTGYERDKETELDFAQARYFSSGFGRFSSPDDFLNDTDNADPQSWNLYVYVRNNPLRFVDPTGEEGTVASTYDEKTNTTTIKITASFTLYGAKGQKVSEKALKEQAAKMKASIEKNYNRTFVGEGGDKGVKDRNYVVSAEVTVNVASSESEAIKTGAGNIVEVGNKALSGYDNQTGKWNPALGVAYRVEGESFDRMAVTLQGGKDPGATFTASHEFGHLLGISQHVGLRSNMMGTGNSTGRTDDRNEKNIRFGRHDFYYGLVNKNLTGSNILTATTAQSENRRSAGVSKSSANVRKWVNSKK